MDKIKLAASIADLKLDIETDTAEYKTLTENLIRLVGEEGETIQTDLGTVQVTQKTEDRSTNEFVVAFDQDKYLALDTRTKLKLEKAGVVVLTPKQVKGQAPRVMVRFT